MKNVKVRRSVNIASHLIIPLVSFGALSSGADAQQNDDEQIEQIVVTGSFIRRTEGFATASPVTTLTADDLSAQGTINMGEVVKNSTFNFGTGIASTTQGTSDSNASFNLRGLGSSATLTLVDGKRVPTQNVQALLPTIAIQRLDILKDGAAALYGSDAVTGVVNYLPYKSYDGFEVEYFEERDERGDYSDRQLQFITGTDISNNINIVLAGSHRQQDAMYRIDRPSINLAGLNQSPNANPGSFLVPRRDANGLLTGQTQLLPDPSCSPTRVDNPAKMGANPYGFIFQGRCWGDHGDARNYRDDLGISTFYTNAMWDVSPDFSLQAQVTYARILETPRESPSNPGGRTELLPELRGELPGNPYRAKSADNRELFAMPLLDTTGSIIQDSFGRPLPLRDSQGNVVLASNPFAPSSSDPLGGVPFNEDVVISSWRPFNDANTLPSQNNSDGTTAGDNDNRYWRAAFTADYNLPFAPSWEGSSYYVFMQSRNLSRDTNVFSLDALQQGLSCDVVTGRDSCFNPFGVTDSRFATPQAVADSIVTSFRVDHETILQTFDSVFNGPVLPEIVQLPGGSISAAVGYQRRQEKIKNRPSAGVVSGDAFIGDQENPRSASRSSDSYFAEFQFPVLTNLELNAAVRDESFSSGQSATVSKFGAVYEPLDWLALRATWGEAFIVPTLGQLDSPQTCGLGNVSDDPFSSFAGFAASCQEGNSNLIPERSETTSFSIDLAPLEGLKLTVGWSETDFRDRIISSNTNDILALDFFNFQQATGYVPPTRDSNPPIELVEQWMSDPRHDIRIIREPGNVSRIQRVTQSDTNASTMRVRSVDFELGYDTPLYSFGTLGLKLDATYMDEYSYQLSPERPMLNATGEQNGTTAAVPAIPRWKSNVRFSWAMDSHSANLIVRYIDSVNFDANESSFQRFWPYSNFRFTTEIHAWTQADVAYTYQGVEWPVTDGSFSFTAGMRNMLDRQAQKVGTSEGFVPELQDLLGRVIYMRVNYEF